MKMSRFAAVVAIAALLPPALIALPAHGAALPEIRVEQAYICWELRGPRPPDPDRAAANQSKSCGVPVRLSSPSRDKVVVTFRTVAETAKPGADYVELERAELVIEPGETTGYAEVEILADCEREDAEVFLVELLDAYGGSITEKLGVVTIVDEQKGC
jgi:hypothetical protein